MGPVGVKGVPSRGGVLRSACVGDRVPDGPKFTSGGLLRFGSLCLHFRFRVQELMGDGHRAMGLGVHPKRILVNGVSSHRAKVRASLVASVCPEGPGAMDHG